MKLILRLAAVPIYSFMSMMLTVAIMGSIFGTNGLKDILGGTSALPVFYVWLVIWTIIVVLKYYFFKKDVSD